MKHCTFAIILAIFATLTAPAAVKSVEYGYASNPDSRKSWGTKRAETYDVAIAINDPRLVGATIKGMKVPVINSDNIDSYSVWMSTELKVGLQGTDRVNKPNVCSQTVTPSDGMIIATFDEPYVITDEGVYVGYSFIVTREDEASNFPVVLSNEIRPDGFWLRSSLLFPRWEDRSLFAEGVSPIVVDIEGDIPDNSLNMQEIQFANVAINEAVPVTATIRNTSGNPINAFDYTFKVGSKTGEGSMTLDSPMPALYNASRTVEFSLPQTIDAVGEETVEICITTVDGAENADSEPAASQTLYAVKSVPFKRVVIEEFTGSWCGNCVRGIAGMELLQERHPDDFIPVILHNNDPMQMREGYIVRGPEGSLPGCLVDRAMEADPYFGNRSGSNLGIEELWTLQKNEFSPVEININAQFNDNNGHLIDIETSTFWAKTPEDANPDHYRIEYVLTEDDMSGNGNGWAQENWLSGNMDVVELIGLREFAEGPAVMEGYKYQDVMLLRTIGGVPGSVPSVEQHAEYTHKYTIDTRDAVNIYGNRMVQNRKNLSVTAYLLYIPDPDNTYGRIINAARFSQESGVDDLLNSGDASLREVSIEYFDLAGNRISSQHRGIAIRTAILSDGSRRTSKLINP